MYKTKKFISIILATSLLTATVGAIEVSPDTAPALDSYTLDQLPQNIRVSLTEQDQIVSVQKDDDPFSITVNNQDGSKTATVFSVPVKYETTDGKIELIDTSIVSNGVLNNLFQGYQYKNKANAFTAEFSTSAEKGIRLTSEGNSITMAPAVADSVSVMTNTATAAITAAVEEAATDDAFVYENVFGAGTRVKYYNTSLGIKEDIILDDNIGKNRFDFEIDTGGDIPILTEDAAMILVYDKDDPEQLNYRFGTLYAYDSYVGGASESGFRHLTEECYYELTPIEGSKYRITVVVPEEWLDHPELVYPVTIDPPLTIANTATNIDDTYVRESSPNSNYYLESRLRIGNYNGTNYTSGKCFTYLRHINMPTLPSNSVITYAKLHMSLLSGQTTAQTAAIWRVTTSWSGSTATWNNKPGSADKNDDTEDPTVVNSVYDKYIFDASYIVSKWYYEGVGKYGFTLAYNNQSAQDLNSLYSSDCGLSNKLPQLVINYVELATIPTGVYYIRNQNSGKYMDVSGQSTTSGANVHQWSFHGGPSQQWNITTASGRWYNIRPMHATNLGLDVTGPSYANSTNIQLYTYHGGKAQRYGFVAVGNGSYRIVTYATYGARGVSVNGRYTTDGANVHQYAYNSNYTNDHWFLEQYKIYTNNNSNINSHYNRNNAKTYAETYADNPNPSYKIPSNGHDCTNFASQCVYSGGMAFKQGDRTANDVWFYDEVLAIYAASYTWGGAHNFALHWGHIGGEGLQNAYMTIEFVNAQAVLDNWSIFYNNAYNGDIIQLVDENNHVFHSMVIHNQSVPHSSGENDVLYAQHTDNKKNESFYGKMIDYRNQNKSYKILLHRIKL